jgi:glycopeptide antibiotics resistance protein
VSPNRPATNVVRYAKPNAARPKPPVGRYRAIAGLLVGLTAYGALLPFQFTPLSADEARAAFRNLAYFPPDQLGARGDWVISAAQYALLSFLLAAAVTAGRHFRARLFAAVAAVAVTSAFALSLEVAQVYFPPRTVSWNDLVVESAGAAAGAVLWLIFGRRVDGWLGRLGAISTVASSASRLLPGYALALTVVQLMPFDFVVSFAELEVKFDEGKIYLTPFQNLATTAGWMKAALNVACFLPLGFLASVARPTRSGRAAFPWLALAAVPALELLQLVTYSRSFDVTDLITGVLGVMIGAALAKWARRSWVLQPSSAVNRPVGLIWLPLFGAWLLIVLYLNWQPFDFTAEPHRFRDAEELPAWGLRRFSPAPFVDYYWGSKYNALDQFIRKATSFVPLGVFFGLAAHGLYPRGGTRRVLAAAAAIGLVIEVGRYFLPQRQPSVTDILIGCAGALVGYLALQHVRAAIWADGALRGWNSSPKTDRAAGEVPQPGIWLVVADVNKG